MAALLEVRGLKAFYGQTQSLYDVGFEIDAGLETRLKDAVSKCAIKANGQALPALKYVQTYAYLHKPSTLCYGDVLALIAVHSNAKNLAHRAAIRRTWGSLRYVGSHRIDVAFFLGRPASGDATPSGVSGAELQALIDEESSRYGDIVQLDFTENYRNMTIKHLSVYEWVLVHCHAAKYLVKVDDDTFTDVAHLATFLSRGPPQGLYCSATGGAKPQRVRKGSKAKWTVTEAEYSDRFYPAYCEGFGYTIQADRIPDVYFCSMFKRFFWIDDVHVTGVLAAAASVPLSRFWRGHSYAVMLPSQASESIMDYIFLTAERSEFFESIWHKLWYAVLQHSLDLNL